MEITKEEDGSFRCKAITALRISIIADSLNYFPVTIERLS